MDLIAHPAVILTASYLVPSIVAVLTVMACQALGLRRATRWLERRIGTLLAMGLVGVVCALFMGGVLLVLWLLR